MARMMKLTYNTINVCLQLHRRHTGLSVAEVSDLSGVSKNTIWGVEKNKEPCLDTLMKLAMAYGFDGVEVIDCDMLDFLDMYWQKGE